MVFLRALLYIAAAASFELPLHKPPSHSPRSLSLHQHTLLHNTANVLYTGQLYLGSPPQNFTVVFDTSSAWTWVYDTACNPHCHTGASFDPTQSSSFVATETSVSLPAGEGCVAYETVSVSPSGNRATNQAVAVVLSNGQPATSDGALGLALAKGSNAQPTFVASLKSQGLIKSASFAIYLGDAKLRPSADPPSTISFGDYNLPKFSVSDFTYLNVVSTSGEWSVPLTGYIADQARFNASTTAVFDTSTSLIAVPAKSFNRIKLEFCGTYSCSNRTTDRITFAADESMLLDMAEFAVLLADEKFYLPSHAYISCNEPGVLEAGECMLLIQPTNLTHWVLGEVFLRQFYVHFDCDNMRVGLARSINAPPSRRAWWAIVGNGLLSIVIFAGIAVSLITRKKDNEDLTKPLLLNERPNPQ